MTKQKRRNVCAVLAGCLLLAGCGTEAPEVTAAAETTPAGPISVTEQAFAVNQSAGLYTGDWLNSSPYGYGTFQSEQGDYIYVGEWLNGIPNGEGEMYVNQSSGETYSKGTFVNALLNGNGYMEEAYVDSGVNQQVITTAEGNFVNGSLNGQGYKRYDRADGSSVYYEGEMLDGYLCGQGKKISVFTDETYTVISGKFLNGAAVDGAAYAYFDKSGNVIETGTMQNNSYIPDVQESEEEGSELWDAFKNIVIAGGQDVADNHGHGNLYSAIIDALS